MLELSATSASVVLCTASPGAVDAAEALGNALRVAPDEALFLGPPGTAAQMVTNVIERARPGDDDAVVLDATDGWAIWTLEGDAARVALTHLSALEVPEVGFVQGDVARVHVKVVASEHRLQLLVPAMWGAHLRERILRDCASLGVVERPEPISWIAARPPGRRRT